MITMISTPISGVARPRRVRMRFTSSDPKDGFDPYGQPRPRTDRADCRDHSRHERQSIKRVVPDGQGFTLSAEQHLLMCNQTAQPDAVNPNTVDLRPTGSRQF